MADNEETVLAKNGVPEEEQKESQNGVTDPDFKEIKGDKPEQSIDMDFLLDIPLQVTVELGSTKMILNDLLQLGQGSVLELPKMVGEPLEVYVNNKLVARGEPVMVNEKFGVRLTDIISPLERIERLK